MSGMSGADSFFYAGLAGGRQNRIDRLEENLDEFEDHIIQQNRQIAHLQRVLGQWQEEAATADAHAGVALKAFKEFTGKSVREHLGDAETNRRLAKEKSDSLRNYGLK